MRIRSAGQTGFIFASVFTLAACSDSGSSSDVLDDADASAQAQTVATPVGTGSSPVVSDAAAPTPVTTQPAQPSQPAQPAPQQQPVDDGATTAVPVEPPASEGTPVETAEVVEAPAEVVQAPAEEVEAPVEVVQAPVENEVIEDTPPVDTVENDVPAPVTPVGPPANQVPVQGEVPALVASNSAAGIDASGGNDTSPTRTETLSLVGPFLKDENRSAGPPSVPTGLVALMASHDWVEFSWVPSVDDQSVEAYEVQRNGEVVHTIRFDDPYEFTHRSWVGTRYMDCNYTRYAFCESNSPAQGSTNEYSIVAIDNEGMRSAPSAPVSLTLPARQTAAPDLTGYSLVMDEEFDAETLDRSLWKTSLPWGEDVIINLEQQYLVNIFNNDDVTHDPFVLNGSTLAITAIPTPDDELDRANNQPYLSGVISTQDNFSFTYGYVEMSAKVAAGQGFLSTFYLFNQAFDDSKPELDILEYNGAEPTITNQTYHYRDSNRTRLNEVGDGEPHSSPTMTHDVGFDLSSNFHTYSMLWEEGLAIWYIDDVEVRRIEGPRVSAEPMNVIANFIVGSVWIGSPESDDQFPNTMEIDYIKVWQQ